MCSRGGTWRAGWPTAQTRMCRSRCLLVAPPNPLSRPLSGLPQKHAPAADRRWFGLLTSESQQQIIVAAECSSAHKDTKMNATKLPRCATHPLRIIQWVPPNDLHSRVAEIEGVEHRVAAAYLQQRVYRVADTAAHLRVFQQ